MLEDFSFKEPCNALKIISLKKLSEQEYININLRQRNMIRSNVLKINVQRRHYDAADYSCRFVDAVILEIVTSQSCKFV